MNAYYKGFTKTHLESAFGVRFEIEHVAVPYYAVDGSPYREKTFSGGGKPIGWSGPTRKQIPYGLETLKLFPETTNTVVLTEGESCAWTLRAACPAWAVLGLPGASSWQPEWAGLIEDFPVVYLSFDGDSAGDALTNAVWPTVPWARQIVLPRGVDTRDLIQLHGGIERYESLIADADYYAACKRYILEAPARLGELHVG